MNKPLLRRGELFAILLAFLMLICIGVFSGLDWMDYRANRSEVVGARRIIDHTNALLIDLTTAESGQRGFLLTGDAAYLKPYEQALLPIRNELDLLSAATEQNPFTHRQILRLRVAVEAKLEELALILDVRLKGDVSRSLRLVQTGAGLSVMSSLQQITAQILAEQTSFMETRSLLVRSRSDRAHLIFILSSVVLLIILALGARTINQSTGRREQLIAQLSEYAATLDKAQVLIQKLDGSILYWNSGAESMYGWSANEALGRKSFDLLQTEYPGTFEEIHAELLAKGVWSGECKQRRRDGSVIWVASYLAVHRNAEGEPVTVVRVNNDITALKYATEALKTSEATARALFENAAQGILTVDEAGQIVDANAMAQTLFGYTRYEMVGSSVDTFLPESLQTGYLGQRGPRHNSQPVTRPLSPELELPACRRNGSRFPVEISLSYVSNPPRGGLAMVFITDITERKQVSQEREDLIRSLERALSEKNVLIKEVHHRVKNNLAVIAGLLGMQAVSLEDRRALTAFEESQKRVMSMALIHEYLYATEHLDRVNFGQYIQQLANELFASYALNSDLGGVKVGIEAEDIDLPVNRAIPCGLILNELFSNALKYAFPGGRKGTIDVNFVRLNSGELLLTCQDNGIGIPETLDWQNPRSSVGFRIISILTRQIDGNLTLNRKAAGTRFELRFPLSPAALAA